MLHDNPFVSFELHVTFTLFDLREYIEGGKSYSICRVYAFAIAAQGADPTCLR